MKTTELIKAKQHERHEEPCHGGKGVWYVKDYISEMSKKNAIIQFVHDDILPSGSAFGIHEHPASDAERFEEWYLCLSGRGIMTLDGVAHSFSEGDISVCRGGGAHGVENTGNTDMRLIVFCAKAPAVDNAG